MKKGGGGGRDGRFIHGGRRTIPIIATGARFTLARGHSHRRTTIRCRARREIR